MWRPQHPTWPWIRKDLIKHHSSIILKSSCELLSSLFWGNLRRDESLMLVAYLVIIPVLYFSESITTAFSGRNFSVLFSIFGLDIEKAHNLYIWVSFSTLTDVQIWEILSHRVYKKKNPNKKTPTNQPPPPNISTKNMLHLTNSVFLLPCFYNVLYSLQISAQLLKLKKMLSILIRK